MSNLSLNRLFYLSCELKPELPNNRLMGLLGDAWNKTITAGAKHGLSGSVIDLAGVSVDQLENIYIEGASSGASPTLDEFRSALASKIHGSICGSDTLSQMDQITLTAKLFDWLNGKADVNNDAVLDFDADVDTPPFTRTMFEPFDQITGNNGVVQGINTIISEPGMGKTTIALTLAYLWRKYDIGPVVMHQTELPPSVIKYKLKGIVKEKGLWRSGIDKIVYGKGAITNDLQWLIENPDSTRLELFDSFTGYCGSGDTPEGRAACVSLYQTLTDVKNASRTAFVFGHTKRGVDPAMARIDSASISSIIEKLSDTMINLRARGETGHDGRREMMCDMLKNRFGIPDSSVNFMFDFVQGIAQMIVPEYTNVKEELI